MTVRACTRYSCPSALTSSVSTGKFFPGSIVWLKNRSTSRRSLRMRCMSSAGGANAQPSGRPKENEQAVEVTPPISPGVPFVEDHVLGVVGGDLGLEQVIGDLGVADGAGGIEDPLAVGRG